MMNFSMMTTSFPTDGLTNDELLQLCKESGNIDHVQYETVLNLAMVQDYAAKGFAILVYNDDNDTLVAAASAIDLMGLNTFEWSMLVHPMYRQIGIGSALAQAMQIELSNRSAAGQLALLMETEGYGKTFVESLGFTYSFSEATLEAIAELPKVQRKIDFLPYQAVYKQSLADVFCDAFGDDLQEALDLIEYNSTHNELQLWVAVEENEVIGTVTTRQEQNVCWITALAVHSKAQGKGIGSALIYEVQRLALENGAAYVKLDVELENDRALAIYHKTGFKKVAQIDYYSK